MKKIFLCVVIFISTRAYAIHCSSVDMENAVEIPLAMTDDGSVTHYQGTSIGRRLTVEVSYNNRTENLTMTLRSNVDSESLASMGAGFNSRGEAYMEAQNIQVGCTKK